jgi:hypothetical protein
MLSRIAGSLVLLLSLVGCEGVIEPLGTDPKSSGTPVGTGSNLGPGSASCNAGGTGGHYTLRRLTNAEYTNTVQDLLFTRKTPGSTFQDSPRGASGYTNDSRALSVYSTLVDAYYETARTLADEVVASKGVSGGAWSKLVTCNPSQPTCAQTFVTSLTRRALRRVPTAEDLDATSGLMSVFSAAGGFDQGVHDVTLALLMHPEFTMIPVVDGSSLDPTVAFPLDDDELAARLSYFLWQSMPDEALFAAADQGTLHAPAVLAVQIKRMLADPRASHLKDVLRDEYADLSFLARTDLTQVGQTNALRDAMIGETDAFLTDLIKNDRSATTLLTSRTSFVNKTLADFYGLPFPSGTNPQQFVGVPSDRMGLGSQASVLTNTAGGSATFTNPIKRGHWVAQKLLCNEPPPPPPGIAPLPPASQTNPSIRQRLEAHVSQPSCQGCHVTMDAVGLGAENYDPFGRWRTAYADAAAVDSAGKFPDGTSFIDSRDMYGKLATQPQARNCVAQQVLKLALSRNLTTSNDLCIAELVSQAAVTDDAHFSDLITKVATSPLFLQQTGEAP